MLYRGGHLYVCPRLVSRCICSSRVDPSSSMSQSISFFFFPSISFIWAKLTIYFFFFLLILCPFTFLLFHHAKRTTTSLAYMRWTFPEPFLLNGKWLDWHSHLYFLGVHPSVFKKLWPCNKKWKLLYCCTRFWLNVMCVTCNSRQAAISQECDILFVWGRQGDDDDCRSQQTFTNIVAVACGDERIQQVLLSETDQGLNKQQNKMTIPVEQKVVNGTKWGWNCLFRLLDFLLAQWECVDKRMELLITWVHLAQMKNIDTMHDCCLLRAFVITLTENFFVVKRNRLPLSAVFLSYSSTCQTRKWSRRHEWAPLQ